MSYLAFDPVRVRRLRAEFDVAVEALRRVQHADGELSGCWDVCLRVRREIETSWAPLSDRVLRSTALTVAEGRDADVSLDDVLAGLGWLSPGWSVRADGTRQGTPVPGGLGGDGVAAAPAEGDALTAANNSLAGWPWALPTFDANMPGMKGAAAALADAFRRGEPVASGLDAWLGTQLAELDAGTAAALLTMLHALGRLDDEQLGWWTATLAVGILDTPRGDPADPTTLAALDELVAAVAMRPPAVRTLVATLLGGPERAARVDALIAVARTPTALRRLLSPVLDPARTDPGQAGAVLRAVLAEHRVSGPGWPLDPRADGPGWAAVLASLSAPWLPWFGPRADAFGWDADAGREALHDLLRDPAGRAALEVHGGEWAEPLIAELVDDGGLDIERVDAYTGTVTLLDETLRDLEQDDDAVRRMLAAPVLAALGAIPVAPSGAPPPVRFAANQVGERLAATIDDRLVRAGWLAPDAAESMRQADGRWAERTSSAAVILFVAVAEQMIARGDLPATARRGLDVSAIAAGQCDAQVWRARLDRFIREYARGPAAQRLWAVRNALLNDPTTAVACRAAP